MLPVLKPVTAQNFDLASVVNAHLIMYKINDNKLTDIPSSMQKFLKVIERGLSACAQISIVCMQSEASAE